MLGFLEDAMPKDTIESGKDKRQSAARRSATLPAYQGPERRKHERREVAPDDIAS